ncbi:MAG: hypothetical protein ACFFBZ_12915 [Promethearchaeota archaeon]
MSEDVIICSKCGKPTKKDNVYCVHCGALLESAKPFSFDQEKRPDINVSPPPAKKKLKAYHKVIIFFVVVIGVDLILSLIIMTGFGLPGSGYFPVFLGLFFLVLICVGIVWGLAASDSVHVGGGATEGCGYVIGGIIAIIIAVPIWIATVFSQIVSAIAEAIGQAIANALNNFFSGLFEGLEIPGFEPFLFIGLFLVLSIFIIYTYHLKAGKK